MRARLAAIMAGILIGVGGVALVATPASASPSWGQMSIYKNKTWTSGSDEYKFTLNNYAYACVNIGGSFDNWTQSIYLNGPGYATFYSGSWCTGNVNTTPSWTSPWKRCSGDNGYGPWFGGCNHADPIEPSSFYYVPA